MAFAPNGACFSDGRIPDPTALHRDALGNMLLPVEGRRPPSKPELENRMTLPARRPSCPWRWSTAAVLLAASAAAVPGRALAADADVAFAGFWVGSEDGLTSMADHLGLPLPPTIHLATLEQMFPFLHPGDLRTDAPVGFAFLAGPDVSDQQAVAFVLPAKDGAVKLDQVAGATKTDYADTVLAPGSGAPIRRTADYLVVGGAVKPIEQLDVAGLSAAMRAAPGASSTPLLRSFIDLAGWRSASPASFATAMDAMRKGDAAKADKDPQQAQVDQWLDDWIRTSLDKGSIEVARTHDGATATVQFEPCKLTEASFARPGLPADCVARADLQVPVDSVRQLLALIPAEGGTTRADMDLMGQIICTCMAGDAESMGLAKVDGQPVLYSVSQRRGDNDFAGDIRRAIDAVAKVSADEHTANDIGPTPYFTADRRSVYRFTFKDPKRGTWYLDVTARGAFRYATLSSGANHPVEALSALPPDGTFDTAGSGWVAPGPLLDLAFALKGAESKMPPEKQHKLVELLGDHRVSWTARAAGGGIAVTTDLPDPLLKAISPIVDLLGS
jgi:hypothetical protein